MKGFIIGFWYRPILQNMWIASERRLRFHKSGIKMECWRFSDFTKACCIVVVALDIHHSFALFGCMTIADDEPGTCII
jgi:hypothetical protein